MADNGAITFNSATMRAFSKKVTSAVAEMNTSLTNIKNAGSAVMGEGRGSWTAKFNTDVASVEKMIKSLESKYTDSAARADRAAAVADQAAIDLDTTYTA